MVIRPPASPARRRLGVAGAAWLAAAGSSGGARAQPAASLRLPAPALDGAMAVERALHRRRSVRRFAPTPLALADAAQLLWAAQGVTDPRGLRSAPSAGALHPLEVVLLAGRVGGLEAGVWRYRPDGHALEPVALGDARPAAAAATRAQPWVADAPALLVIAADVSRTARRYGERAERYVPLEAGAAAQNVYLQAAARGLATVFVGAFDEATLRRVAGLPPERMVLALMPVGHPG